MITNVDDIELEMRQ